MDRKEILPEDLPEAIFSSGYSHNKGSEIKKIKEGRTSLAELEIEHIRHVLNSVGGNKSKAARILGISRKKLYNKLENI